MSEKEPTYQELKDKVEKLEEEIKLLKSDAYRTPIGSELIYPAHTPNNNDLLKKYTYFIDESPISIYTTEFDQPINTELHIEEQIDAIYENAYLGTCNTAMAESYGLQSKEELLGKRMIDFHGGANDPINRETFRRFISNGYKSLNNLTSEKTIQGDNIYFISNDFGEIVDGKLVRIWGSAINISEFKKIEENNKLAKEAAEQSELQFRQLFENMEQNFALNKIIYNENGKPVNFENVLMNSAFKKNIRGYLNDTMPAAPKISEYEQKWFDIYSQNATLNQPLQFETYSDDFSIFYEVIIYTPTPGFYAVIATDVSENKNYERNLIKAIEKAEESDKLKSTFLKNISHEIRTPMNSICGFSDLLFNPKVSELKKQEFSKIVHKSINQLLYTVENILTISLIETHQIKKETSQFHYEKPVEEVFEHFRHLKNKINKEHIIFTRIYSTTEKVQIQTDFVKLKQILDILVDNAFKFTENGEIEIGCYSTPEYVAYFVKDTGIGIPKTKLDFIFKSFTQADENIRQIFGGLGLGLSIVIELIKFLDGTLIIDSEEDKGTKFEFHIPITPIINTITSPAMLNSNKLKNKTLLIAEDEAFNFMYVEQILEDSEIKIIHAPNGASAVELFTKNDVDVILMDIKMPKMDGFEATKIIRSTNISVPIIAQTAFSYKREECLEAGFTDYLTKPYTPEDLTNMLMKYLN